jgi:SIR2-like domain/CHAT domain
MAPKPPASLVRYLVEKRCVLFCGSGLSAWAKLPTWKKLLEDLVKQLADEAPDNPDLDELNRMLAQGKLLEIADHCKEALGRRYNEILSEQLRGATGDIPAPHKVVVQLPFANIVTTNYDKLLERAYASVGSLPKTPTHADCETLGPLLFDGGFFILKAHGDIDRPESMVLTTRDYQDIIHANPAFNSLFSALLLTKSVLFIGYSLNDPDFQLLFDRQLTVFRGSVPERYALMTGVGKVERDVLWRTARIRVLPYDEGKHEQVLEFLRALLDQVNDQAAKSSPTAPPIAPKPTVSVDAAKAVAPAIVGAVNKDLVMVGNYHVVNFHTGGNVNIGGGPKDKQLSPVLSIDLRAGAVAASLESGDKTVQAQGPSLDWAQLRSIIPGALSSLGKARLFGQELARRLPPEILKGLEQISPDETITLKLSPEVDLLPWEWTIVNETFLAAQSPLARAPSSVSDAARGYPILREATRVLLIGDPSQKQPGKRLPGALAEVGALSKIYEPSNNITVKTLIGPEASFDNVAECLSFGYDIIHYAGHAWFDELEPFLVLSDEVKLRASEMRSLLSSAPPAVLFLNSHYTIFVPPGAAGRDALQGQRGFVEAASTAGVGALIGSFSGGLKDDIAQRVGVGFHRKLIAGVPVAQALHDAQIEAGSKQKGDDPSHLSYALSGYGDIRLPEPQRKSRPASRRDRAGP